MQSHENTAEIILALDIGGTFIKSALFCDGKLIRRLASVPSRSEGTREEITASIRTVCENAGRFDALAVAVPGPFDYRNGISLMKHKFSAMKGVPFGELFAGRPVRYIHDANAFLLGEFHCGAAGGYRRAMGITLGTGIGAAFMENGCLWCNELGAPDSNVSLWNKRFRDGTVEEAISASALIRKSGASNGLELAEKARSKDREALRLWREFGDDLALVLTDLNAVLHAEIIVLGGQLSNSFEFFKDALRHLPVTRSELGELAALYGGVCLYKPEYSTQNSSVPIIRGFSETN